MIEDVLRHADGDDLEDAVRHALEHHPGALLEVAREAGERISAVLDPDDLTPWLTSDDREQREVALQLSGHLKGSTTDLSGPERSPSGDGTDVLSAGLPAPDDQMAPIKAAFFAYGRVLDAWLGRDDPPEAGEDPLDWAHWGAFDLHQDALFYGQRLDEMSPDSYEPEALVALAVRELAQAGPAWLEDDTRGRRLEQFVMAHLGRGRDIGWTLDALIDARGGLTPVTTCELADHLHELAGQDDDIEAVRDVRLNAGRALARAAEHLPSATLAELLPVVYRWRSTRRDLLAALLAREDVADDELLVAAEHCTDYGERKRLAEDGRVLTLKRGRELMGESQGREVIEALLRHAEGEELAGIARHALRHHPEALLQVAREVPERISGVLEADDLMPCLTSENREQREVALLLSGYLDGPTRERPDGSRRGR